MAAMARCGPRRRENGQEEVGVGEVLRRNIDNNNAGLFFRQFTVQLSGRETLLLILRYFFVKY
jgi:hypothetical protein